jgi:hypothetical protein
LEDGKWILSIKLEDLIGDPTELHYERPDIDTLLPIEVRYYLEILNTGLRYASLKIIVVPVRFRVPLRWIVHEAVIII